MKTVRLPLLVLTILLPTVAFCGILSVPGDAPTLADAYQRCESGDTLLLYDGMYQTSLTFGDKDLTIASEYLFDPDSAFIQSTILLPDENARLFTFDNTERVKVALVGLTFQEVNLSDSSGVDNGGIVYGDNLDLTIEHCTFSGNHAPYGSCLFVKDSRVRLHSNTFIENSCEVFGGAVTFYNVDIDITHNRFVRNLSNYYAGALVLSQCSGMARDNVFLGNYAVSGAGAIYAGTTEGSVESLHLDHNAFVDNVSLIGGAVYTLGIDTLRITGNLFRHNMATLDETQLPMAGALYIGPESESVDISGNEFHHNLALNKGGVAVFSSDVDFHDNLLLRNQGNVHYALATQYANANQGMHARVYRNLFYENSEYTAGVEYSYGAISACNEGLLTAYENDFYGNTPYAAGLNPELQGTLTVSNNYWGDPSGPKHGITNPAGMGDTVMAGVEIKPFATEPFTSRWLRAPEPFTLGVPVDGAFFADSSLTFSWQAAEDATPIDTLRYTLELSMDASFADPMTWSAGTDTFVTVSGLEWESVYRWRVIVEDIYGLQAMSGTRALMLTDTAQSAVDTSPAELQISQLYPNPCEQMVRIVAAIPRSETVSIEVVNLSGEVVSTVQNGPLTAGEHSFAWQPEVDAGVYVVVLRAGDERVTRKLVHVKREQLAAS
ncbi:T9SS type A sorting domain-containing protein [bacterium]|nr:T9SS type A sorting domain-containing protein [bacterium]